MEVREERLVALVETIIEQLRQEPARPVWLVNSENAEESFLACGSCEGELDRAFVICPYCGRLIAWPSPMGEYLN